MQLDKVIFVFRGVDIQAATRHQASFVERVLVRMAKSYEFVVLLELGNCKPVDDPDELIDIFPVTQSLNAACITTACDRPHC